MSQFLSERQMSTDQRAMKATKSDKTTPSDSVRRIVRGWIVEGKQCRSLARQIGHAEPDLAARLRERAEILRQCAQDLLVSPANV